MRISTKGRYGARAMVTLAANYGEGQMRASKIAEEQGLSRKYLENLLSTLRSAGLLASERGRHGGYTLARSPAEISLYSVLKPLEDTLDFVHCTGDDSGCERLPICSTREVWMELKKATDQILMRTTLSDLAKRQKELEEAAPQEGAGRIPLERQGLP